ncbi:MAG: outer membrane lipoprotein-sorting protein, partial [Gammaproteobacteria bacterium]
GQAARAAALRLGIGDLRAIERCGRRREQAEQRERGQACRAATRPPRLPALALLGLLAPAAAALDCAQIPDAEAQRCCARSLPERSMQQTVRATVTDASGTLREIAGELSWKRLDDGYAAIRVDVSAPPADAGTSVLLTHRPAADDLLAGARAYLYDPNQRRDRLISVDVLTGELLGLGISYEDFAVMYGVRDDLAFTRLPDEDFDGRRVIVVEAAPRDADAAYDAGMEYARIVARFDAERCVALDTRFYEQGDEPRKRLVADPAEIREQDGRWVPHRVTLRETAADTQTTITIESVTFDPDLHDVLFNRSSLKRGR